MKLRERGDLQGAAGEFQRAVAIDPSSPIAEQELRKIAETIGERNHAEEAAAEAGAGPAPADAGVATTRDQAAIARADQPAHVE